MQIYKEELPDHHDIINRIHKIHGLKGTDREKIEEQVDFFLTSAGLFIKDYENYTNEEIYGADPTAAMLDLESYGLLCGGLCGIGVALFRKFRASVYERLTIEAQATDSKKKLSQGDKDEYAKGEASAVEGSLKMLDGFESNIKERLANYRNRRLKY